MTLVGAAAFLVLLPLAAAAQRIEVALLGGAYRPAPVVWVSDLGTTFQCDPDGQWWLVRQVRRGTGTLLGGRLTVGFSSRLAIDVTVHRAAITNDLTGCVYDRERVTATFLALQPSVRMRLDDFMEVGFAIGPALSVFDATPNNPSRDVATSSGGKAGVAASVSLRAHVLPSLILELRGSNVLQLSASDPSAASRYDLTVGAGLVWVLAR